MPYEYGWENRSELLKSLSASLIAGFLYLMLVSTGQGFSAAYPVFGVLFVILGLMISGLSGAATPIWAVTSGVVTGSIIVAQQITYMTANGGMSLTDHILTIVNLPLMILVFLAGYAAVYVFEHRDQLF